MPPQNLGMSLQQQQQQHNQEQQMSHTLVDHNTGIGVGMAEQHAAHSLEHAHSMVEHAAHGMLDLSETGSSLEHLAGGGHSSQLLADLASGRALDRDQSIENLTNNGRRHLLSIDRISGLTDGLNQSIRQRNNDRDISGLNGSGNANSNNIISHSISGLGRSSLVERQGQPMRNFSPVGAEDRGGQNGGNMFGNMGSDVQGNVGLGGQCLTSAGSNRNGLQDVRSSQPLNFSPEHASQSLLDSAPTVPRRGRPPSMNRVHHALAGLDHHRLSLALLPQMRGQSPHGQSNMLDHHHQNLSRDVDNNNHNGQTSLFTVDNTNNGQLISRPGSTLLSEANSHAHDLTRSVYSTSSVSGDRAVIHQSTSRTNETSLSVASNLNKSSPDGNIISGSLPPNSLLGLGINTTRSSSVSSSHLGQAGDDSLVDLVGRHHNETISMLSERASQSLSGLIDENSMNQSPGHSHGRELEKTHPCLSCLKLFRSKQQLAQHSLVHTGIRKHICSFCDRAFKQLSHLQQHVRIHTGEKPYRCKFENCDRAFAQLANLQHHMRNHDDQVKKEATRIHKCQICHRCYTNESSLKSHTLKMHIHIKPLDQHSPPIIKKKRKRKNKHLFDGAPTMVPVSSSADGAFSGILPDMKPGSSRLRSPTTSSDDDDDDDDDEIIFMGEQIGPINRIDNFGGISGGQGHLLQGAGDRNFDLNHQISFSGVGNFPRGADPLALLASANRFNLQDNMISSLGGQLNSFSDQLALRDAALLNSRFGDLRSSSQGANFDDRFSSGNFNSQQSQRDRDGFGEMGGRGNLGNSGSSTGDNSGGGGSDSLHNGNNSSENRNQIPAHSQAMLRGTGLGSLMSGVGGMMHGDFQGALGGLIKQIKQEPLDYFPSSCHGGDQFSGMGVGGSRGFLSPQHIINSHLRGQLPSLNVPLIRDHFSHSQMLPHFSSSSPTHSSTPVSTVAPSTTPSTSLSIPLVSTASSPLVSLPLPLTHMGLYHQPHFSTAQRMSGMHPSPASTPSSQMSVGGNLPSNLSSQEGRSPLEQEDLRCFSPLRH